MVHQVHTYADLRKQIHEGLRIQHPEWVQPNGESPLCDFYEARLMELLQSLNQANPTRSCERGRRQLSNDRFEWHDYWRDCEGAGSTP